MNSYSVFDSHAHYNHSLFEGNGVTILNTLFSQGIVNNVLIPAITYESNFLREGFPNGVYFGVGVHPKCASNEHWDGEKRRSIENLCDLPETVAVKTGLDFSKARITKDQKENQISSLKYLIDLANRKGLPLILHVRNAAEEIIEIVNEKPLNVNAVVHCFTYGTDIAQSMKSVGITKFGIGGMITRDNMDDLRECIKEMPLSDILLESDAPFVKPKGFNEKINTSKTLIDVATNIAELKGLSVSEVVQATNHNTMSFLGLTNRK